MKKKLYNLLFILGIAFSCSLLAPSTSYAYLRCAFVPGHWAYGRWMPAHQNCWRVGYYPYYSPYHYHRPYYGGCWWVPAHRVYGGWVPGHRVCR